MPNKKENQKTTKTLPKGEPLVIVYRKNQKCTVAKILQEKKVHGQGSQYEEGIQIRFKTEEEFRVATKDLQQIKLPYHIYAWEEAKTATMVNKGVSEYITEEKIKQELKENQIKATNISMMIRKIKSIKEPSRRSLW